MTTTTRPGEAGTGARPPAVPSASSGRYAHWRGSWAVSLKMARREVRRHRGRSLITLLMVGVPTALLVFGLTFYPTSQITGAERIPYELGNAVASFQPPSDTRVAQTADGDGASSGDPSDPAWKATPLPGYPKGGTPEQLSAAIAKEFGGTVQPFQQTFTRFRDGDRSRRADLVVVADPAAFGTALRLTAGRWPTSDREVVVTQAAVDTGLLSSTGEVTLDTDPKETVRIVGVADVRTRWAGPLKGFIATTTFGDRPDTFTPMQFLFRDAPFTWAEVKRANAFGMAVLSAEALRHPPAQGELDPLIRESAANDARTQLGLLVSGGAILLLVVTLLVGPAFAVGAARQRRTLALAASNGATTKQLRRTVLAQALVLGALAAVAGAAAGVLAVPVVTRWIVPLWTPWTGGRLDIPWLQILGITAMSVLSAIIAALIPASRLGRLDIVGVMKGQNVSKPPSKILFVVGLVGAVLGGVVLFFGIVTRGPEILIVGGAVFLIVGALFLVPVLLTLAARLAGHLPVSLRMATRDAARQRTRSAPSVAAIVGAVAALTMMGVGLTSDTEQQRREYVAHSLPGEASLYVDTSDPSNVNRTIEAITRTDPSLVVVPVTRIAADGFTGPTQSNSPVPFVAYRPTGCTTAQTLNPGDEVAPNDDPGWTPRCMVLSSVGGYSPYSGMGALDLAELDRRFQLSDGERGVLQRGGALVFTTAALPPRITLVTGTAVLEPNAGTWKDIVEKGTRELPVVTRPLDRTTGPALVDQIGFYVTTQTAKAQGWPLQTGSLSIHARDGAISTDTEDRLNAALDNEGMVQVERGFQRQDALVMGILVGVFAFLILVITLTSTALSMAEQRRDDATLAAVGATRRTRRGMAAAQATVISLIGSVIGLAVGLVPGIAITYPLTGQPSCDQFTYVCGDGFVDPIIEIPWLWFAVIVVAVPAVAALISALGVRREPVMTRRAS